MNGKRFLAFALTLCMLLTLVPVTQVRAIEYEELEIEKIEDPNLGSALPTNPALEKLEAAASVDPDAEVKVIIVLRQPAVAQIDTEATLTPQTQLQMSVLEAQQDLLVAEIEADVLDGEELEVDYNYTWILNAVATTVPYGSIAEIEAMDEVASVVLQQVYTVCETATPDTITDGAMIGREPTWASGYTGQGMKIAIIDTGLDVDHPNFGELTEDQLTDTSATAESVAAVLDSLNASSRLNGLTVEDVYYSSKVVYGFNYVDNSLDITHDYDEQGDHGTHVAGIAAANKIETSEVCGVAPDAQLYIMKVFGTSGGAYTMDILAALEDALMLGADVVNMSLGSPAGFTSGNYTEEGDFLDEVYESIAATGTILSVSAGNNYSSALGNAWGNNMNPTAWPDNGIVGAPGTYANTMTVSSVENVKIQKNYVDADGNHIPYVESGITYGLPLISSLTGEYELVAIPGVGDVSDYEGLDVTGKVVLVQRGTLSFVEKHTNAEAAGAAAILVYSNTTGEFGMDMTDTECTTPAVAITMADGEYLIAALAENPGLTVSFPAQTEGFPNENDYEISDFTSVGPSPDLTLAPDITAPGGNIYSTINDGEYGLMSGTSMAAPNIAGMSAVVMQYVRETFPEGTDYRAVTQALLMSTSTPLTYQENGQPYSPRSQGSGLANAYNSVTTNAYLTVDGADNTKADLGDDPSRTGVFTFSYNVHNFGDSDGYYRLDTNAQTEDYVEEYGVYFMSGTPMGLDAATEEVSDAMVLTHDVDENGSTDSHDAYLIYQAAASGQEIENSFRYDVDADEAVSTSDVQAYLEALVGNTSDKALKDQVLKVKAGETAVVDVTVTLADADKTYLDTYYVNGGYVEGFSYLTALHDGGVDLSLPYLGFYGGWGESSVLDTASYIDVEKASAEEQLYNQNAHVLWTDFYGEEDTMIPGLNPYVDEAFDEKHIALSPNGDGYMDSITDVYVSLMRNAKTLSLSFTDLDTQEEYWGVDISNVNKTVYRSAYSAVVPFAYDLFIASPGLYDWSGLENNTTVLFKAEAVGLAENDEPETWEVPIYVDLEAPELLSAAISTDLDTGKKTLELTFQDNHYVSAVVLLNSSYTTLYSQAAVEDPAEADENGCRTYTYSCDITDITGKIIVAICDYAANEGYYALNLGGAGAAYGELVAYQYNYYYGTNGWVSFGTDVDENEVQISLDDAGIVCAEYVNGYVFAQDETGALYGARYEELLGNTMEPQFTYITTLENVYQDLAYNYADGKLYGLYTYEDTFLDGSVWPYTCIYGINMNGAYFDEEEYMEVAAYEETWDAQYGSIYGLTLAIDDEGMFYIMAKEYVEAYDEETYEDISYYTDAQLWTVTPELVESRWGSYINYVFECAHEYDEETGLNKTTGLGMDYLQSMTWDHNNEKLYWARFYVEGWDIYDELYEVNPENGECTLVGDLTGETYAMFAPLSETAAAKTEHANVPEMDADVIPTPTLRDDVVTMSTGSTYMLTYDLDPWYSSHTDMVWTSSDETVVTVDANGKITALSAGSATITIAAAEDETKCDSVEVTVTALSLTFEGIVTNQGAGVDSTLGAGLYEFSMDEGVATMTAKSAITASDDMNFGLSLATSELGRGYVWACEYGNTGMVYKIDPTTGEVVDFLEPIDGDMLFGMHYSEAMDSFTAIMDMYLYVDQPFNAWAQEQIINSYDEDYNEFMWRKLDLLPYLIESNTGFITGEDGNGASSEIVFCGITGIDGGIKDSYGDTFVWDSYKTYLGDWDYSGTQVMYQPTQTLILLDNVGRIWYIDVVDGLTKETDDWGNVTLSDENGSWITGMPEVSYDENWNEVYGDVEYRNGVMAMDIEDENGNESTTAVIIRSIQETPLTKMFREGSMPRITYHFSDIEFAGYTADGDPMIAMSLYDYWNSGTTNELYLYIPGHETDEFDYDAYEYICTPDRLFSLGTTGENNIIATIHAATVTGGIDEEPDAPVEAVAANALTAGVYKNK